MGILDSLPWCDSVHLNTVENPGIPLWRSGLRIQCCHCSGLVTAVAQGQSLAWEPLCAASVALKKEKKHVETQEL